MPPLGGERTQRGDGHLNNPKDHTMTTANQTTSTNGSESCNTMTVGGNLRQRATDATERVKPFLSRMQFSTMVELCQGEEGDHFLKMFIDLAQCIDTMPKTYEQDGLGEKAVAHLHYFMGASDWFILEKDMEGGIAQAFGYAILNGDLQCAEVGYISIEEITRCGAELDLYFNALTLAAIKKQRRSN